jgi:uncharacterized protein
LIISATQSVLGLVSGMLVGFSLGLVGGGGSILAVPLMVYVVGVPEPHLAIGTSAIAVAANAAVNLSNHARGGTVVWSCALPFAAAGMIGALGGSILGKMLDGQKLLALFALIMLVIAALMLKTRARVGVPDVKMNWSSRHGAGLSMCPLRRAAILPRVWPARGAAAPSSSRSWLRSGFRRRHGPHRPCPRIS